MLPTHLLAIRHIEAAGRRIAVLISRNERGSVEGRVLIGKDDAPILDGASIDELWSTIQLQMKWLMLARKRSRA